MKCIKCNHKLGTHKDDILVNGNHDKEGDSPYWEIYCGVCKYGTED